MSRLQENDRVFCSYCGTMMEYVLFCKTFSQWNTKDNDVLHRRCQYIVCESCEYCMSCEQSIQRLKQKIKISRPGKNDVNTYELENNKKMLKNDYGIEV